MVLQSVLCPHTFTSLPHISYQYNDARNFFIRDLVIGIKDSSGKENIMIYVLIGG